MNRYLKFSLVAVVLILLAGCSTWERTTFQTLAAAQATINQAQADYESGTIKETRAAFTTINAAKLADTTAVNQMIAYEELKVSNPTPTALQTSEAEVSAAVSQLPTVIANVKALYTTGGN